MAHTSAVLAALRTIEAVFVLMRGIAIHSGE